jgi:hypothetical protein
MEKIFGSSVTSDEIVVKFIKKAHKAIFIISLIDNATEHLKLVVNIIEKLKEEDIKWVEIESISEPKLPPNTISYTNKFNGNIVCHIEDFERFYLLNIRKFIRPTSVYCLPPKTTDDGWIVVSGNKKVKNEKYITLLKELDTLIGDWNTM